MEGLVVSSTVERLRSLVGTGGWDYCIIWKISQDQRSIQLLDCCCAGAGGSGCDGGGGEEEQRLFPVLTCRDSMFQHPRTAACDSLAEVPPCINLDSTSSGIYAQVLVSNQPRWVFLSNSMNSSNLQESIRATQVLVPVPGGLVELFISEQVPEDQNVIDFVVSQYCSYSNDEQRQQSVTFHAKNNEVYDSHPWQVPANSSDQHPNFQFWDQHVDNLSDSPLNLFGQPRPKEGINYGDGSSKTSILSKRPLTSNGALPAISEEVDVDEKEVFKRVRSRRGDSVASDGSNLGEEDEENKSARGGKKQNSCKNLLAERRRRKKLNDRLYVLRSLVPDITKMDRASILGDAIKFVKKLQDQVKELQEELEKTTIEEEEEEKQQNDHLDVDDGDDNKINKNNIEMEMLNETGLDDHVGRQEDSNKLPAECSSVRRVSFEGSKQCKRAQNNDDSGDPPMEPQVDVFQISRTEFFVKVFCQYKSGGFLKLMEDMNSLGFEVTNANVTTSTNLVLNVLKVEKRDTEVVEASQVKDSLVELMRPENEDWPGIVQPPPEPDGVDYFNQYNNGDNNNNNRHSNGCQSHLHYIH